MEYQDIKKSANVIQNTPLPAYNLINMTGLLAQNRYRIGFRYIPRFLFSLSSSMILSPFRIYERLRYDKIIYNTDIKKDPIFIIGHYRSGTTYMHNIMTRDKQFGYFTTFQSYMPSIFLTGEKIFKPLLEKSLPKKRAMDDVPMAVDHPQEDQYAVGGFKPYSYSHGYCFPKNIEFYNRYVTFDNVRQNEIDDWKNIYLYLIKKITYKVNGKQILSKNQDNTAKIKEILELFPNAKFILMKRNPYNLYYSMMKFLRIVLPLFTIQKLPPIEKVEDSMMTLYEKMFKKYLNTKYLIPKGNLIEVKYEDLISNPLDIIEKIYNKLDLKDFKENKNKFEKYLKTQNQIKLNKYEISDEVRQKINLRWDFAFNAFKYKKNQ